MRSPRVSTLRARSSVFLRRRLLSIDMAVLSLDLRTRAPISGSYGGCTVETTSRVLSRKDGGKLRLRLQLAEPHHDGFLIRSSRLKLRPALTNSTRRRIS